MLRQHIPKERCREKGIIMSILPEGEQLRKAVKWVSDERTEHPEIPLYTVIEKACLKFDLTPKDEEFLMRYLMEGKGEDQG